MKREKLVNQYYELRKELKAKGDYEHYVSCHVILHQRV